MANKEQTTNIAGLTVKPSKHFEVIVKPLITEKAAMLAQENKYVFAVDKRANKHQIAQAVEKLYKVHVLNVNVLNNPAKRKGFGRLAGSKAATYKAIVEVKAGEKIEIFQ
jgi:large subunit ribosomal protein L23